MPLTWLHLVLKKRKVSRRLPLRRPRLEMLESRRVLAAVINEIHFPIVSEIDQYVEIRGEPNETLGNGVYLAAIDCDAAPGGNPGLIHTLFDLSGLQLGANGFLAIRQAGSPYAVHPAATLVEGTQDDGFAGLRGPGDGAGVDRFSDTTTVTDRIDHVVGSNTFLLFQSSIAPAAGQDIDSNDDGAPDGVFANWTVLDALSVLDGGEDDRAYAPLVFAADGKGQAPSGAVKITTTPAVLMNYIGRNDDTTGAAPEDWIVSETKTFLDPQGLARLSEDTTLPPQFTGRRLEHLGAPNFLASITGTVFADADADGVQEAGETGLTGVTIFVDRNNNGVRDSFTTVVEPDDFPNWDGANSQVTTIRNDVPGVTFTVAGSDNTQHPDSVPASVVEWPNTVTGIKVFSQAGVSFFSDAFRFRLDFYEPATSVSIDLEASSDGTVGRLIAFDRNGAQLQSVDTATLARNGNATLTVTRSSAEIAMVIAYGVSGFAHFDRLRFTQPERSVVSGADGTYEIPRMFPGAHVVAQEPTAGLIQVFPPAPGRHNLTITDTRNVADINFGNRGNQSPQAPEQEFSINENSPGGAVVGVVEASDADSGQTLNFAIVGGSGQGRFNIHPTSGQVTVAPGTALNFETTASFTLDVRVSDNAAAPASTIVTITIHLNDVNEPATAIQLSTNSVAEDADTATGPAVVAALSVTDPDSTPNPTFTLVGGSGSTDNGLFEIDGVQLRVKQGVALDHETRPGLEVRIRAADGPHALERTLTILVSNVNEPATAISLSPDVVSENADTASGPVVVGALATDDPDVGAAYDFTLVDGEGAADNAAFHIDNGRLVLNQGVALDRETKAEFSVRIRAADGTHETTSAVTVRVSDANEPPQISEQSFDLAENSAAGVVVGVVQASDADQGQSLTFALVGGTGAGAFAINAATGELSVVDPDLLDFEAAPTLTLNVRVTDNGAPVASAQATVTIHLTDANDPPTDLVASNLTVSESADEEGGPVVVGELAVVDPDAPDAFAPFTFSLTPGGSDNDAFEIAGKVLRFKTGIALDAAVQNEYSVRVQADDGEHTLSKLLTVRLTEANDPPSAHDDAATATKDQPATIAVLANDTDDDSPLDIASIVITTPPAHGSAEVQQGGVIVYTPDAGYVGEDTFGYTVSDLEGAVSNEATVVVQVLDAPPWHNPVMPQDANQDGNADVFDLLLVVQFLRDHNVNNVVLQEAPEAGQPKVDIDGNGVANMADVLSIVTHLRNPQPLGDAEPETESPGDPAAEPWRFFPADEEDEWETALQQVALDVARAKA